MRQLPYTLLRLCTIAAYSALCMLLWQRGNYYYLALCLACMLVIMAAELYNTRRADNRLAALAMAIRYADYSHMPVNNHGSAAEAELLKLYYTARQNQSQLHTQNKLLAQLLEGVDTQVMILKQPAGATDKEVFLVNTALLRLLHLPRYKAWEYYRQPLDALWHTINQACRADTKTVIDIAINHGQKQAYTLTSTAMQAGGDTYYLIFLESIQSVVERKEKHAYFNLMKVISHELLNTITPISTWVHSMRYIMQSGPPGPEDTADINEGLEAINTGIHKLVSFVSSYREMTELPPPALKRVSVVRLVNSVLGIMRSSISAAGVNLAVNAGDVYIMADEEQMQRVLINLFTNSLHALEDIPDGQITVTAVPQGSRVLLQVQDNGPGVNKELLNRIFMPFFSTRPNGTGIGLALAKSIMDAHGGYITYSTQLGNTVFELSLTRA